MMKPEQPILSVPVTGRRSAGRPKLFPQVKRGIEQLIDRHTLQPGMALESEKQLAERFGVSRPLVRKALRELADEKRIITLPGKGHFVADPQAAIPVNGTVLCLLGAGQYSAIWRDPHVAAIAEGLEQAIASTGHRLLFELVSTYKGVKDNAQVPLENLCGVLVVPLTDQVVEPLLETLPRHVPRVIIGRPSPWADVPSVIVDHAQATRLGMAHLLQNGHRRIIYLGNIVDSWYARLRLDAYHDAMTQAGCHDPSLTLLVNDNPDIIRQQLATSLPALLERSTAIFAGAGTHLSAVVSLLREMNLEVGKDVSLVAYDDLPMARESNPPITTIAQPTRRLGATGVDLLLGQLNDRSCPLDSVTLQGELIVRQSVASI